MKITLKQAIDVLIENLKDPGYYIGWQANIAMSVYDELVRQAVVLSDKDKICAHAACNDGAKIFLDRLTYKKSEAS